MDLTCLNDHMLKAGQKYCGECGAAAKPADEKTACGCGASMLKAAKFCSECGQAAGPVALDLDAALTEVDSFIKSAALLDSELHLDEVPAIDASEVVDDARVQEIIRAASVVDKESGESLGVDALPVVTEFLKGQALGAAQAAAYQEHTTSVLSHLVRSQQAMLKSIAAIGGAVRGMQDKLGTVASAERPKRVIERTAAAPAGKPEGDDIGPADLMVKAIMATGKNVGVLSATEVGSLETYTNAGIGLRALRGIDPGLATRVEHAIASTSN